MRSSPPPRDSPPAPGRGRAAARTDQVDGAPRRRLLALLRFRDEEAYLADLLVNLRGQVDGIVALDDGSSDGSRALVAADPLVLEILPAEPWTGLHDARLNRRLTEASWHHQPDWLLGIDADERVEEGFRDRAEAAIDRAEHAGLRALAVKIREVWDHPERVRVDGLFGRKQRVSLFRARRDHVFDERRLHGHWGSLDDAGRGIPLADLTIFHLRMLREVDRRARRRKHELLDPGCRHQPMGYAYMTSTAGLRLEAVEPGRSYRPLPHPDRLPADPLAALGPAPRGPSLGVVLRCHRDAGLVAAIVELVREAVDEVVVVADERMTPEQLGTIAAARPTAVHRIPHVEPNERGNAFAQSLCATDWVLRLCGDEIPSLALLEQLRELVADDRMTNYRVPIAWLWPDEQNRLDQRPWWPDYQPRLLRNDGALYHYPGTTHGGLDVEGACRLLEAPILHLDLLISPEEERRAKIARYERERPGIVSAGVPLNGTLYLPGSGRHRPATAAISEADAAAVRGALARRGDRVDGALLALQLHDIFAVDARWNARPWPPEAYAARLSLAFGAHDLTTSVGRDVVHVVAENLGVEVWPGALATFPLVRLAYRLWDAEGELVTAEGTRTPFPGPVRPGERVIVPMAVDVPFAGQFELEIDIVHEHVRWFGTPLRLPLVARDAAPATSNATPPWRGRRSPVDRLRGALGRARRYRPARPPLDAVDE